MRAREFIINVPINIKIDGDGKPEVDMSPIKNKLIEPEIDQEEPDDIEHDDNLEPLFVPPLQQEIELKKAAVGKNSKVIRDLVKNESRSIYRDRQ
jgi:hypothetical protein